MYLVGWLTTILLLNVAQQQVVAFQACCLQGAWQFGDEQVPEPELALLVSRGYKGPKVERRMSCDEDQEGHEGHRSGLGLSSAYHQIGVQT